MSSRHVEAAQTVHFTREELYQLVWKRPVQDVARRISVSGVALGKTCADSEYRFLDAATGPAKQPAKR